MTDELSDAERRALEILRKEGPMRAAYLGSSLWCKPHSNRHPQHFARPAGNLLKKMEAKKLVVRRTDADGFTVWERAVIRREDPAVRVARLRAELLAVLPELAVELSVDVADVHAELRDRIKADDLPETALVTRWLSIETCLAEAEEEAKNQLGG